MIGLRTLILQFFFFFFVIRASTLYSGTEFYRSQANDCVYKAKPVATIIVGLGIGELVEPPQELPFTGILGEGIKEKSLGNTDN